MEGTNKSTQELEKQLPSADEVAQGVITGVEKGDFAICNDSKEGGLLFANMLGPSPKRGIGIVDSIACMATNLVLWPALKRHWEKMIKRK